MNILYPAGIKREWFDRNGIIKHQYYAGTSIAPHAQTNRFTYSVPAGRLLMVMGATMNLFRRTVAAPIDIWGAAIRIESGGNSYYLTFSMNLSNVVWFQIQQSLPVQIIAYPNDIIRGWTSDASTGGTVDYYLALFGLEFDQ